MTLEDIKALITQIKDDPSSVDDAKLTEARDAIQEIRAAHSDVTPDNVKVLRELVEARKEIITVQEGRAADAAKVESETAELLAGLDETDQPQAENTDEKDGDTPDATVTDITPKADDAPASRELEAVAASLAQTAAVLASAVAPAKADKADAPQGRPAGRIGQYSANAPASTGDVVTARTYGGKDAAGSPIANTFDLAKTLHDKYRTVYQDSSFSGRIPIAHVGYEYPESRRLGADLGTNFGKIEAATAQTSLVAAGGLCAPLETLYDVEVIGSAARPVRDALTRFQVERGGITYRPNTSAAAAVNGAGQWTMDDDEATDGREKSCYVVDCPGLESEFIWAAYLCLEFGNITTRFDPETTASNIQQGAIAHARLAENLLLSKMAADSKLLTGARVIGAVRDLLVNVDKAQSYLRNRHRIDTAMPLQWMAPAWVRHLMRADLARQMAAGDWKEALGASDAMIAAWFSARDVTPVWHLDGFAGSNETQTVTITGTPTGGTFTLTYNGDTTAAIAYNATAADVESALSALDTLDDIDITVTGGPGPGTAYVVAFDGSDSAGVNVAEMTSSGSFTGGTTPAVAVATTSGGDGAVTVNGVAIPSQTYDPASAGGAIPGFPDKIDSLLYAPGSFLFLDGGSLDLGLVRDSGLNARNRYRQFMETFEGVAHRGVESLRLVMEVQPTGQTSGTKDLNAIVD